MFFISKRILALSLFLVSFNSFALPYKVAFIPKGYTHAFWKEIARGAEKAAEELKIEMFGAGRWMKKALMLR